MERFPPLRVAHCHRPTSAFVGALTDTPFERFCHGGGSLLDQRAVRSVDVVVGTHRLAGGNVETGRNCALNVPDGHPSNGSWTTIHRAPNGISQTEIEYWLCLVFA